MFWLYISRCIPFCFFTLFFHSPLHLPPPPSLNSIAYRRVIRVYQYEVDDDLSGRSSPFFPPLIGLLPLTPHLLGFLLLMHLSLIPTVKALCVCSIPFTNIHCDEAFFEMNPSSFLIQQAWLHSAPVLRSVNTSSHSFNLFFFPCFSYLHFFFFILRKMFMHQIQGGNCNVISMIGKLDIFNILIWIEQLCINIFVLLYG